MPAHVESLRTATGKCARFVVATVAREEIPRIGDIDADLSLSGGPRGQACRAAYDHESGNTRVTLRATSATPR